MKKLLLTLLLISTISVSSQPWISATPFPDPNDYVNSILNYNGELYIGGDFTQVGGLVASKVAKWNGTNWSTLGSGLNYTVNDLIEYNGDIYAATTGGIYKWDGSSWSSELTGLTTNYSSLCIYNSQIAASRYFASNEVILGSNMTWSNVGSMALSSNCPTTLCVYNNELYCGAGDNNSQTACTGFLVKYNGATWVDVTGGSSPAPQVAALSVYNSQLIAGGTITNIGGITVYHMAAYDGVNWSSVGNWSTINSEVSALSTINNTLYAGSLFGKWSGTYWQKVLVLNGNQWDGLGNSNTIYSNSGNIESVFDIRDYNNELFVAGNLYAGLQNQPYHFIKLDGYNVVGIDDLELTSKIELYPNPTAGNVNITLEEASSVKIVVRNQLGQTVAQEEFKGSPSISLKLDVPAGLYFLQLDINGNIISKKIIKL